MKYTTKGTVTAEINSDGNFYVQIKPAQDRKLNINGADYVIFVSEENGINIRLCSVNCKLKIDKEQSNIANIISALQDAAIEHIMVNISIEYNIGDKAEENGINSEINGDSCKIESIKIPGA